MLSFAARASSFLLKILLFDFVVIILND